VSELAAQRGWTTVADFGSQTAQAVATACEALKGASFTAEEHEIVFAAVAEAAAATAATMFLERIKVPEIPLHLPQAPTTAVGQVVAEEIQANNVAIESMDRYGDLEALSPRISEIVDTATAAMGATDKEKLLRLMSTLDMVSWICCNTYSSASEFQTTAEQFCMSHRLKISGPIRTACSQI
jgi:hypothetical protein